MIRNPFSLEKIEHKAKQGVVVYRSKLHATLKRNVQTIPDRGEHLVRYYGWYSNRSRGDHIRGECSPDTVYKRSLIDRLVSVPAIRFN